MTIIRVVPQESYLEIYASLEEENEYLLCLQVSESAVLSLHLCLTQEGEIMTEDGTTLILPYMEKYCL